MAIFSSLKYLLLAVICFLLIHKIQAQLEPNFSSCGTDEINRHAFHKQPILRLKHQQAEETILNHTLHKKNFRISAGTDFIIPIVVHIIHNNGSENISDAQILAGIQHLNQSFSNTGVYSNSKGIITGIQFCLAKQDELGNASSGITRTQTPLTNMLSVSQDMELKNTIRWNPNKYLNIWVVNEITSESAGAGVAGYAYFPPAHGTAVDGIVCEANYFGSSPDNSKILIHELGHYLGLYHTFEGACSNSNCLTDGDRVCDTPPDASSTPALCAAQINTCSSDEDDVSNNNPFRPVAQGGLGDQTDMISNYMDYGIEQCRINFTAGQTERMITALTTLRKSLLESSACNDLCPTPIHISFTPADTSIVNGATINFLNTTTGALAFKWYINGILFSTLQNPTYTFTQQGNHTIKLIASNASSLCIKEIFIKIKVNCAVKAAFTGPNEMRPDEQVTFTNTNLGTNTYEWFVNETSMATTKNFTHTFNTAGGFNISLVSFNGTCYDTIQKFIKVGDCLPGNQGNVWYFGWGAGVDFSGDEAVSVSYPFSIPTLYASSTEACVSISDANGKFLFLANPKYVFNKDILQMPNGSGLMGDESATQMAAIPNPDNPDRYYIFTLDALGGPDGFRYSEIDMTLNGGLGDVVTATKNTLIQNSVTEKITTVKHGNGTDTWVIVHEYPTDAFYAYQVSSAGISNTPVISHVGSIHTQDEFNYNTLGQLKASPDGCKLALAINAMSTFELFNFNNLTGQVTMPVTFTSPDYSDCYGIEFSPDGSKLYVGTSFPKILYQFNLNAGTTSDIINSRVVIADFEGTGYLGSLQVGPYGKIYTIRTGESFLGVINNPNALGTNCNFVPHGVDLGTGITNHGLPAFNQSYFYNPKPSISGKDTICTNTKNVEYKISNSTCSSSINVWTLKGKGSIVSTNDSTALLDFNGTGIDTLIVERTAACGKTYDTLQIVVRTSPVYDIEDTTKCASFDIELSAGSGFETYLWQDNSTQQNFTAISSGKYWVTVSTSQGCIMTDTIRVLDPISPEVDLGADIDTCLGVVTILNAGIGYKAYKWQDDSYEPTLTTYLPGKYWVTVTNACGATDSDTIQIFATNNTNLDLGGDLEICNGESITLNAGSNFHEYLWQNGSSGNSFTVLSKGVYWVLAADPTGCYGYDSISVYEKLDCCREADIPNLITPNNDHRNETFEIGCIFTNGWTLEVYNRWGKSIYVKDNYQNDWSGENVSDGIYFYMLKKDEVIYKGWLQIAR